MTLLLSLNVFLHRLTWFSQVLLVIAITFTQYVVGELLLDLIYCILIALGFWWKVPAETGLRGGRRGGSGWSRLGPPRPAPALTRVARRFHNVSVGDHGLWRRETWDGRCWTSVLHGRVSPALKQLWRFCFSLDFPESSMPMGSFSSSTCHATCPSLWSIILTLAIAPSEESKPRCECPHALFFLGRNSCPLPASLL